jgi:CheY-like chemotaxis protein
VLVVDPNEASRDIHTEILSGYGIDARSVASADDAIEQLLVAHADGRAFDAVVFDTDLEAENASRGVFFQRVRENPPLADVKIVLLARVDASAAPAEAKHAAFTVTKPIHQAEWLDAIRACMSSDANARMAAASHAQEDLDETGAAEHAPQRILVVEDSIANQKVVRAILGRHGHALEFAGNGREALERLAHADFDLVLMDVQMPEMDGLEATAAIRAGESGSGRHIRIVAMTAHAMAGDREKCLAVGMDDYVSKPVRRADLVAALDRAKEPAATDGSA